MRFPIYRRYLKRCLDMIFATAALAMLAPVMLTVGLLISLTMGRPVIFRQQRVGWNEAIFTVFKFRTMSGATGPGGQLLPDSQRLTRLGKVLRLTSLDELPQLWNIVRGDMSFVGPRPLRVEYLPYYTKRERTRHSVRPGLTGLAQISGRNDLNWTDRLELDCRYVVRQSFTLDLFVAFVTIGRVLRARDVLVSGDACPSLYDCRPRASDQETDLRAA